MDKEMHDKWFRKQVDAALNEADKPSAELIAHEEVAARWEEKRENLQAAIDSGFSGEFRGFDIDRIKPRLNSARKENSDIS